MTDAADWRKRAEEYKALAARAATPMGRIEWLKLALKCEVAARELEAKDAYSSAKSNEDVPNAPRRR